MGLRQCRRLEKSIEQQTGHRVGTLSVADLPIRSAFDPVLLKSVCQRVGPPAMASLAQKLVRLHHCCAKNGSQSSLRHIAGMIRNGRSSSRGRVPPDLVASFCAAIELKSESAHYAVTGTSRSIVLPARRSPAGIGWFRVPDSTQATVARHPGRSRQLPERCGPGQQGPEVHSKLRDNFHPPLPGYVIEQ